MEAHTIVSLVGKALDQLEVHAVDRAFLEHDAPIRAIAAMLRELVEPWPTDVEGAAPFLRS